MYKTETEKHNLTVLSDSWSINGGFHNSIIIINTDLFKRGAELFVS